jgi:hypothetical protein
VSYAEELRQKSRQFREEADAETTPKLKELLVRHALALHQLAEKVEQDKAA